MVKKFLFSLIILVSSFAGTHTQTPYVVLVSFDGFRHDYVERYDLPNFKAFIDAGSRAEALIPSFPSKTFPNHYTIVTGLYPGHHGLVDNQFYDNKRKETYSLSNRKRVTDPYYYGGTPLWTLVHQNGMKSASYFWVGSEIPDEGYHPDYYYSYDESVSFEKRIDKVIEWLRLPEQDRPHFITLYFSSPDHEGHDFGPLSVQTNKALHRMDSLLGKLMKGIKSTALPVNVILVSDHGMKELEMKSDTFIFLDELLDLKSKKLKLVNGGTQTHIYTANPHQTDSLYAILKSKESNFKVIRKSDFKREWNYDHYRVGDLLILANPGYYIHESDRKKYMARQKEGTKFGVHGYDPDEVEEMCGIFYAQGPNINSDIVVPPFRNIHIYPLIAEILNLPLPEIDGKKEVLQSIYRK